VTALVLDGGLATRLEAMGHDLSGPLWSARLIAEAPQSIVDAHLDFIRAGADVITTASYQTTDPVLVARSVALAKEAVSRASRVSRAGRPVWIAGSVGPYGAVLADGSEYRGNYGVSHAFLKDFHRERMRVLVDEGVDLLALETMPDVGESEALLEMLDSPAWLSYSIRPPSFPAHDNLVAVGVNCCPPSEVLPAVRAGATIAYPNDGSWAGVAEPFATEQWLAAGVKFVGGCCRVSPSAIAGIAGTVASCSPSSSGSVPPHLA
jgi:homocysteine S-methyltransferase